MGLVESSCMHVLIDFLDKLTTLKKKTAATFQLVVQQIDPVLFKRNLLFNPRLDSLAQDSLPVEWSNIKNNFCLILIAFPKPNNKEQSIHI